MRWTEAIVARTPDAHPVLAAAVGPTIINVLGYDMPVLSVITAVVGVVLAYCLAPTSAREPSLRSSVALLILFAMLLVVAEMHFQHTPLIALGWAIGLGYSGRVVLEEIGGRFIERVRGAIETLFPKTTPTEKDDTK